MNILPQNSLNPIQPNRIPFGGSSDSGSTKPFSVNNLNPTNPETKPDSYKKPGSMIYGNVSLDLYFGRAEYQRTEYTRQGEDGSTQTMRQELYRKFEAGLSLDFSFMARFEGAAEKMAQLDPAVFDKWMSTASGLMDLKDEDFEEFVKATDELFNEIEKVLGMGPDGLDHIANFFSSQVDSFLDDVKEQVDYFDTHPLGEGEDLGLGIPGLLQDAKDAIPDNFKQFMDELLAQLSAGLFGDPQMAGLQQLIEHLQKLQAEFFDQLTNNKEKEDEDEDTADAEDPSSKPEGEETIQPYNNQYKIEQSYYMEEVRSFTASYSIVQQDADEHIDQGDGKDKPPPLPLDLTA